eukprot:CAMPEP_0119518570 /NCGR_PEP_ID=MMETSP1344-20130328/35133_1 /TAXON_ID=236787 /ORGANISM="Florenciella parvula, Strain CCMP2471" /LENGTH=125 /DNA_ID=CAMNT_0007556273 /DNA_START=184 /DNA_END=559 /DNA_ORIENTATION=+
MAMPPVQKISAMRPWTCSAFVRTAGSDASQSRRTATAPAPNRCGDMPRAQKEEESAERSGVGSSSSGAAWQCAGGSDSHGERNGASDGTHARAYSGSHPTPMSRCCWLEQPQYARTSVLNGARAW